MVKGEGQEENVISEVEIRLCENSARSTFLTREFFVLNIVGLLYLRKSTDT